MKERFGRVDIRSILVLMTLVALCTSAVAQENTADDWYENGRMQEGRAPLEDVIKAYDKAIEINPNNATYWAAKGSTLSFWALTTNNQSAYNESLQAYNRALQLDPKNPWTWDQMGSTFLQMKRYNDSLEARDKAILYIDEYQGDLPVTKKEMLSSIWAGKAFTLQEAGRTEEALAAFDTAIEIDPGNYEARMMKGRALEAMGKQNGPFHTSGRGQDAGREPQSNDSLMTITNVTSVGDDEFIEIANFENATQSFKDLYLVADEKKSVILPDFNLRPGQRIRIHFGAGLDNETDLFLASDITLDDVSGNLTLKDPASGLERFMAYWTPDPAQEETADYWFEKSSDFLDNRSIEEADQALDKALQLDSKNTSIWLSKALVLELLSKGNESQAAFGKALDLTDEDLKEEPQDADAWWSRGVALDALQKPAEATVAREKAVEIYNRTLSENPQDSDTWFKMAEVLVSLYREDEAISAYRRSAEQNGSKKAIAWLTQGYLLEKLGRHNESIEAFDQALLSMPAGDVRKRASVWEMKAISLEEAGQKDEALLAYERLTEVDPQNTIAWLRQATLLKGQKNYDRSLQAYEKVLELQPQSMEEARAWMGKGDILNETGKREEAITAYSKALEIEDRELQENPEGYIAWLDKGRVLYRMGRYEEAIEAYNSAASLSPESMGIPEQAWLGKGEVYLKMGKNAEALEAFRQAIELYPLDYDAWHGKGLAFQAMGKRTEADMAFEVAEKLGYQE